MTAVAAAPTRAKVARLACYSVVLPLRREVYTMSHGRRIRELRTTVVEVVADDGTTGHGEACTLGANYIDGFSGSVIAAVAELAPVALGHDVFDPGGLNAKMDAAVLGHRPAKAAIDAAFWDLRGKMLGQPVAALLGGARRERFPLFAAVSLADPDEMVREALAIRDAGYTNFQLKLGDDPTTDAQRTAAVYEAIHNDASFITCDGNRGWTSAQARLFLAGIAALDVYFEQPCEQLTQLAELRKISPRPLIADETIREPADLLNCLRLGAADAINIKPARVGGLTKAARLRDLAEAAALMIMVDEPMGSAVAGAGIGQLATTCDPNNLLCAAYVTKAVTETLAVSESVRVEDGWGHLVGQPGLGVEVDRSALGEPVLALAAD